LGNKSSTNLPGDIVGIYSQVKELENLLILDSDYDGLSSILFASIAGTTMLLCGSSCEGIS
jgi:hypothetical protein